MKPCYPIVLAALMAAIGITSAAYVQAEPNAERHKAHHVVIVWLKKHGDEQARRQYIEESRRLAEIPGVLAYNIGTPALVSRDRANSAVDDSYDLAVSSVLESRQALENYLQHPKHHKITQEILKPLVDKYKVYDFVD